VFFLVFQRNLSCSLIFQALQDTTTAVVPDSCMVYQVGNFGPLELWVDSQLVCMTSQTDHYDMVNVYTDILSASISQYNDHIIKYVPSRTC